LESMFHWLFDDIGLDRFKIEVAVEEKTVNTRKMVIAAVRRTRRAAYDAITLIFSVWHQNTQ